MSLFSSCTEFFNSLINISYIEIFLRTKIEDFKSQAKSFIPGIGRTDVEQALIPIPSCKEQIKICDAIHLILNRIKDEI